MEENTTLAAPEAEQDFSAAEAENQPAPAQPQPTVSVKFNKEIKTLTAEEAATLAQKGLKFQMIENDFLKLKDLAAKQNLSVPKYLSELEKQGAKARKEQILSEYEGSEALADRIVELEGGNKDDGLDELREYFPTVKDLSDLPRAVVESARLRGENLLNAYLKYRLVKKRRAADERLFEKEAANASVGSLKSAAGYDGDEFIKALWGK